MNIFQGFIIYIVTDIDLINGLKIIAHNLMIIYKQT